MYLDAFGKLLVIFVKKKITFVQNFWRKKQQQQQEQPFWATSKLCF